MLPFRSRGFTFGESHPAPEEAKPTETPKTNPLAQYCEMHKTGRGIFKWNHYFEIYHRHLSKFVGQSAHLLEIGIFSGGSLQMWADYLGAKAHISGVDIEEVCRSYETRNTSIYIGDQADRSFWSRVRLATAPVDIVIDDGGHLPEQQIATLEELLPQMRPGGVYICEDIHGSNNRFASYVQGLSNNLNTGSIVTHQNRDLSVKPSNFQESIQSIHLYPFVVVIELNTSTLRTIEARRRGTEWQAFV